MKYLAMTAAALFLLAAPGSVFAQSDDGGNNNGGNDNNAGSDNNGGADANEAGNKNEGAECPVLGPSQNFDSFPGACRNGIDIWVKKQTAAGVTFDGEVAVGTVLPDTVEFIEVPAYRDYGYVMLNDRRVLVDRNTRTVVRVF